MWCCSDKHHCIQITLNDLYSVLLHQITEHHSWNWHRWHQNIQSGCIIVSVSVSVCLNISSKNIPCLSDICSDVDLLSHHTHLRLPSTFPFSGNPSYLDRIASSSSVFLALFFVSQINTQTHTYLDWIYVFAIHWHIFSLLRLRTY